MVIIYIFWGDAVYFIYLTIPVCLFATFQFWYFSFIEQRQWFDWDVNGVTGEAFWFLSKNWTVTQFLTLKIAGITDSTRSVALKCSRRFCENIPWGNVWNQRWAKKRQNSCSSLIRTVFISPPPTLPSLLLLFKKLRVSVSLTRVKVPMSFASLIPGNLKTRRCALARRTFSDKSFRTPLM